MNDRSNFKPGEGDALIVVDVQKDFLPGGNLGVPDGDAVVAIMNRYLEHFRRAKLPLYATRDWHPEGHCSFEAQGGPWPP
ncbi:MAG TPA: isochorismatase family protein, partial [Gammaproteobacteria bacterium]|nr:isochorismatase family protein [Gammaproteobacteria bacterium]